MDILEHSVDKQNSIYQHPLQSHLHQSKSKHSKKEQKSHEKSSVAAKSMFHSYGNTSVTSSVSNLKKNVDQASCSSTTNNFTFIGNDKQAGKSFVTGTLDVDATSSTTTSSSNSSKMVNTNSLRKLKLTVMPAADLDEIVDPRKVKKLKSNLIERFNETPSSDKEYENVAVLPNKKHLLLNGEHVDSPFEQQLLSSTSSDVNIPIKPISTPVRTN